MHIILGFWLNFLFRFFELSFIELSLGIGWRVLGVKQFLLSPQTERNRLVVPQEPPHKVLWVIASWDWRRELFIPLCFCYDLWFDVLLSYLILFIICWLLNSLHCAFKKIYILHAIIIYMYLIICVYI